MTHRTVALLLVALAALTACSGGSSKGAISPGPSKGSGASEAQIKLADLPPCPRSSATAVSGGLPDVTLSCLGKGPAVDMAGLTGKPTVVNLWGSWCPPCQDEMKYLSSVYDANKGKVRFLGVDTVDDPDSALNFDAKGVTPPVRYPSVFDPDKRVLLGLHFFGPPETVFLNRAGKIVHIHGSVYSSAADLRADLSKYLHVG